MSSAKTSLYGTEYLAHHQPVESYELDNSALACNRYLLDPLTPEVVDVPSGARVGMWWWGYVKGASSKFCISSNISDQIVQVVPKWS
jgi:hypothetical protein